MFGQAQDHFVLGHFLAAAAAAAVKNCVRPGEILQCAGPNTALRCPARVDGRRLLF